MYPSTYVDDIPLTEMGLDVGVGRTHMFYKGTPEFPFGHGLSYSTWNLSWNSGEESNFVNTSSGQMLVILDGRPIITSRDTVFCEDWKGFAFFNAGDDVSIRVLRDGRLVVSKHFVELRARMAGEPERSVLRTGGMVRVKHPD